MFWYPYFYKNEITRPGTLNEGHCIDTVVTDIHDSRHVTRVINTHLLSDHHALLFKSLMKVKNDSQSFSSVNKKLDRLVN